MPRDVIDVIDLAQSLIATPSPNPPGDERAVAQVVAQAMSQLALPAPALRGSDPRRVNVVSTMSFGAGGRHLALCGHIDTKPVGDAAWQVDPFREPIAGDKLYGLGSGDMKAAVAAMVVAAGRLRVEPPACGKLTLVFAADEEDGATYGARHLAQQAGDELLRADAMVIGEPGGIAEDFDRLHVVSRGIARLRIVARAQQGHSSLSGTKGMRNAGVDLARAVTAIADDLELALPKNADALSGWEATINTALRFAGGVGYGVLPGKVAADTEVRLLPGMRRDEVEGSFSALLCALGEREGSDLSVEFDQAPQDWLEPAQVAADELIVASARRALGSVRGRVPELSVFPGTTDATWFAGAGIPTLPALGPGLLSRAHGADEWVSVTAVREAVDLYEALVREFCAEGFTHD